MNKIFLTLLLGIFVLGGINAAGIAQICIDLDHPSLMNSSLTLTATNNNINLNWIAATDIPDCSGIDYYDIWGSTDGVNFSLIANTLDTTYTDTSLSYGNTYYYMIHVFDLAGHNEGEEALSNSLYLSSPSGPTPSGGGGGGGGGIDNFFSCGDWEECIDGTQIRTCVEVGGSLPDRIESRDCFPEFIPLGEGEEEETLITEEVPAGFFATITGAVVGTLGTGGTVVVSVFIILIVIVTGFIIVRNYQLGKNNLFRKL